MNEYNDNHPMIQKAKRLVGNNPEPVSEEQIRKYSEKAKEILREKTPEERAENEMALQKRWEKFSRDQKERNREYVLRILAKHYQQQRPKRFFGIKIGWWY